MKLLIVTQKVDREDPVLGFMLGWLKQFALQCEQVTVLALEVRKHDLPGNIRVFSLGKEGGRSRIKYLWNFYKIIFRERAQYDAVFVHMNHEYVVLGSIPWKLMRKTVALWYAHGHVPRTLKLAERGADMIFASTKSGFRLPTNKLQVIGQGIDIDAFGYIKRTYKRDQPFVLVVVGRISPVKDYETLIRATAKLVHEHGKNVCTFIVGGVGLEEQQKYLRELKQLAEELEVTKRVEFVGAKPNHEISEILEHAHCFVNTSRTGSLDKAMVEAMATGLPLVTSNESMQEVLGGLRDQLMFKVGDSDDLTGKLEHLIGMSDEERNQLGKLLRDIVVKHHQLKLFVQKILATMGEYGRNKD